MEITNKQLNIVKVIAWAVIAFVLWTFVGHLLSTPSTFLVWIGVLITVAFVVLTWLTRFFTKIGPSKKDDKSNINKI